MAEYSSVAGPAMPGCYGASPPQLTLGEATIAGLWNVQGDHAREAFVENVTRTFGISLPLASSTTARSDRAIVFWVGPASWLIIGQPSPAASPTRDALNGAGGALFDVSSSRVAFRIAGERASTVLAKRCPLDFHLSAFPDHGCAQSLLGHIGALFYRSARTQWLLMVPRSYARDAWRLLCTSAIEYGYEVIAPSPFP